MMKIQAIIREDRLQAVTERLAMIGIRGLTVAEVRGFGRSGGHDAVFRGSAYKTSFLPKVMLEWYGSDKDADKVARAIERSASTGKVGDGKIFMHDVEEIVRIRTGERGVDAL